MLRIVAVVSTALRNVNTEQLCRIMQQRTHTVA